MRSSLGSRRQTRPAERLLEGFHEIQEQLVSTYQHANHRDQGDDFGQPDQAEEEAAKHLGGGLRRQGSIDLLRESRYGKIVGKERDVALSLSKMCA